MRKRLSLRIRLTLMASAFLLISCTALTIIANYSANKMMDAVEILPIYPSSDEPSSLPITSILPSTEEKRVLFEETYQIFQKETTIATIIIVLIGSVATYLVSGYVLQPIEELSTEVRKRHANNLNEEIPVSKSVEEIKQLTISFNELISELHHSFMLQKQFSADAAHELRTPLAVMQAKLDVFALSHHSEEDVKDMVRVMNQHLERLTKLIEDLLWFSRDLPLENFNMVELVPLLSDVVSELQILADEKDIQLNLELTDCCVKGQDHLLERVFYNLIENAIKYSPNCTMVSIQIKRTKDYVAVYITDQGEGIDEEYRELIFQPFYRIDKSRSRTIGGSGLGLAVVWKILEKHHATIEVRSNKPQGSIFCLKFPS